MELPQCRWSQEGFQEEEEEEALVCRSFILFDLSQKREMASALG